MQLLLLEQVAKPSDVVFSCLLNDAAVTETTEALLKHLKSGSIIVEQSTIALALVQELSKKAEQAGVTYVNCPIMGPPSKAISGDLIVLIAGGNDEVRAKLIPLMIPVIGERVTELGQDPAESLRLKLCGNYFAPSIIEMVAEGLTLGEASGVGQGKVKEILDAVFPNTLLGVYASRMLNNTYNDEVAFSINGAKKDVKHIKQLAEDSGAKLPITDIFSNNADTVLAKHGDYDLSSVVCSKCSINIYHLKLYTNPFLTFLDLREQAGLHPDLEKKQVAEIVSQNRSFVQSHINH